MLWARLIVVCSIVGSVLAFPKFGIAKMCKYHFSDCNDKHLTTRSCFPVIFNKCVEAAGGDRSKMEYAPSTSMFTYDSQSGNVTLRRYKGRDCDDFNLVQEVTNTGKLDSCIGPLIVKGRLDSEYYIRVQLIDESVTTTGDHCISTRRLVKNIPTRAFVAPTRTICTTTRTLKTTTIIPPIETDVYKGVLCPYREKTCTSKPQTNHRCFNIEFDKCMPPHYAEAKWYYKVKYNPDTDVLTYNRYDDVHCVNEQLDWNSVKTEDNIPTGSPRDCIGPVDKGWLWQVYVQIMVKKPVRPNNGNAVYTFGTCPNTRQSWSWANDHF